MAQLIAPVAGAEVSLHVGVVGQGDGSPRTRRVVHRTRRSRQCALTAWKGWSSTTRSAATVEMARPIAGAAAAEERRARATVHRWWGRGARDRRTAPRWQPSRCARSPLAGCGPTGWRPAIGTYPSSRGQERQRGGARPRRSPPATNAERPDPPAARTVHGRRVVWPSGRRCAAAALRARALRAGRAAALRSGHANRIASDVSPTRLPSPPAGSSQPEPYAA